MIHPDVEIRFISEEVGYGAVARRLIPRGTITWVRDDLDRAFTPAQLQALSARARAAVETWGYVDPSGEWILCWDAARFVNHSCDPSCMSPGWDFEIAVRDIPAGAELTDDYASLNLGTAFECRCGSPRCRGGGAALDLDALSDAWDRTIAEVLPLLRTVPQPLWELVKASERAAVEDVLAGRAPIPSVRTNRVGG